MRITESKAQFQEDQILLREGILKFPVSPDEKPQLIAAKCEKCGDIAFPKKIRCGKCDGKVMNDILLNNRGKLYAFTVVRQAVPGYQVPYVLGVIKLPEDDKLLIIGQIHECDIKDLVKGMEVETVVAELYTDCLRNKKVIGYAFKTVKDL